MTDPRSIPSTVPPEPSGESAAAVGLHPEAEAAVPEPPAVSLLGESLHAIDERGCIQAILDTLAAGAGGWLLTLNTDILRRARRDPDFRAMAAEATLRVPDGIPLLWAASIQGTPLPERVAGSNLIDSLSAAAAEADRSVFLLGGEPGAADTAAKVLGERYPNLRIAGTYCPPKGFEDDPAEMDRLRHALIAAQPDIVYVALGCPKQERVIARLRGELPRAWWLGVGISFSFLSGRVRRAPRWMQRIGLEWVHRLSQEPRRLARRYLVDDLPYGFYLLGAALLRRFRFGAGPTGAGRGTRGEG